MCAPTRPPAPHTPHTSGAPRVQVAMTQTRPYVEFHAKRLRPVREYNNRRRCSAGRWGEGRRKRFVIGFERTYNASFIVGRLAVQQLPALSSQTAPCLTLALIGVGRIVGLIRVTFDTRMLQCEIHRALLTHNGLTC